MAPVLAKASRASRPAIAQVLGSTESQRVGPFELPKAVPVGTTGVGTGVGEDGSRGPIGDAPPVTDGGAPGEGEVAGGLEAASDSTASTEPTSLLERPGELARTATALASPFPSEELASGARAARSDNGDDPDWFSGGDVSPSTGPLIGRGWVTTSVNGSVTDWTVAATVACRSWIVVPTFATVVLTVLVTVPLTAFVAVATTLPAVRVTPSTTAVTVEVTGAVAGVRARAGAATVFRTVGTWTVGGGVGTAAGRAGNRPLVTAFRTPATVLPTVSLTGCFTVSVTLFKV